MQSPVLNLRSLSVFVVLFACLGVLSACASKKKDYTAKTSAIPYNVVALNVSSLDPEGDEFARQFKYNLEQSLGGPQFNAAKDVRLTVNLHPNGLLDQSTKSLFRQVTSYGGAAMTATIRLHDAETGTSLKYEQITASSTRDDIEIANIFIAEDMVAQIRAILGLTSYPPRPIDFQTTRQSSYSSISSESASLVLKSERQIADPLLNGQITPETNSASLMQQMKDSEKEMSEDAVMMKKKVNNQAKMVKDVMMEPLIKPEDEKKMETKDSMAASDGGDSKEDTMSAELDDDSELCIVTVENDCLGPNLN